MDEIYKPLPENLILKKSRIHGLGIFANEDIKEETILGQSHYLNAFGKIHRTPLGGFYNHSDKPNTIKIEGLRGTLYLKTLRPIKEGQEITVKYTFYEVGV